jgi:hypothetical protein
MFVAARAGGAGDKQKQRPTTRKKAKSSKKLATILEQCLIRELNPRAAT